MRPCVVHLKRLLVGSLVWIGLGLFETSLTGSPSLAGTVSPGSTTAELARYQGADREQRLVQGTRREGRVVIYTSMTLRESQPFTQAFQSWLQRRYGIQAEVTLWRANSEDVLRRVILEAKAGRHEVDVIDTNGPELEILKRESITTPFWSPYFREYPENLRDPQHFWHANRVNVFVQAYNKNLVRGELPTTWQALLDPRWKGRISVEAGSWDWFATIVKRGPFASQEAALAFFDRLRAQDLQVREGHALSAELLAAGEFPLALAIYSHQIEAHKRQGAPVDWFVIEPAVIRPNGVAMTANAPHPHTALLYLDFVLSREGQQKLAELGRIPAHPSIESDLSKGFRFVPVDVEAVIDEAQQWQRIWEERVVRK